MKMKDNQMNLDSFLVLRMMEESGMLLFATQKKRYISEEEEDVCLSRKLLQMQFAEHRRSLGDIYV